MKRFVAMLIPALSIVLNGTGYAVEKEALNDMNNLDVLMQEDTVQPEKDTTEFKFKNKKVRITEDEKGTDIEVRDDDDEWDFDDEGWDHDWEDDDGPRLDFDFSEGDEFDLHWAGFEIGLNNFVNQDFSMNYSKENAFMDLNTGKSWNVNINFLEYDLNLAANKLGLGTGMGLEFNDYRFDNQLPITKRDGGIEVDSSYAGQDYNVDKAKLTSTYITVPLILEYQVKPGNSDNKFFISAGVIGGLKLGSHTKVKYEKGGDTKKDKARGDFYLSPFRYGYTARIGYGFMKVFANYYDTTLFESGKGPELHPFTIGFTLSF